MTHDQDHDDGQAGEGRLQMATSKMPRQVQVSDLFGTEREIILIHGNSNYRLRITASNKLILTK